MPTTPDERRLVQQLRDGDEAAFRELVRLYSPSMLRVAMMYVSSRAVAEEVVQEAWLGVIAGLDRFEGRSSLRTWIFRILTNTAKTRGQREGRSVPFSSLAGPEEGDDEPAVPADRFLGPDHRWAGHWASSPRNPRDVPEAELLGAEARERIAAAIEALPENQRAVISLRDVDGFDAEETSGILGITDGNQRVLLHRARAKVRAALEDYLDEEAGS
ncbi:MAG TPA: sigma-70 family RNA polymerase sigma factor [Gaiellaceae bacterium]|nr:sigma-70 family RNA polymerase sigma factor [Gaiellaceae bacterium]